MDQIKIGKFIAQLRKEQGLTQSQLAEKLNISNRTISKWETGNGMPDVSVLGQLCAVLNVTSDEFFAGERNATTIIPPSPEPKSEKEDWHVVIIIITIVLIIALCLLATCGLYGKSKDVFFQSPTPTFSATAMTTSTPQGTDIATETPVISITPENIITPENTETPDVTASAENTLVPGATDTPTPTTQIIYVTMPPINTNVVGPTPTATLTTKTATPTVTQTITLTPTPTPTLVPTPKPTPKPTPTPTIAPTPTATPANSGIPDSVYGGYKLTSKAGRQSGYSYYYMLCGMNDSPLSAYSDYTGNLTLSYNIYNPSDEAISAELLVQTNYGDFWCYTYPRNYNKITIPAKTTKRVTRTVSVNDGKITFYDARGNHVEISVDKAFLRFDVYFNEMEKAGNQVVIFANSNNDPILNCAWYSSNHMIEERIY